MFSKTFLLIFGLMFLKADGICIDYARGDGDFILRCNSSNPEELLTFTLGSESHEMYKAVIFENSEFGDLDVFSILMLKKRYEFIMKNTSFEDIHFENDLRILALSHMNLSEFIINKIPYHCDKVDLSHNNLEKLIDLRDRTINILNLSYNNLKILNGSFRYVFGLREIDLSHNRLRHLYSSDFPSELEFMDVSFNEIISIDPVINVASLNAANNFIFDSNFLLCNPGCMRKHSVNLSDNKLNGSIEIYFTEQVGLIDLSKNSMYTLNFEKPDSYVFLDQMILSKNNLSNLEPYSFKNLIMSVLDLSENQISYLHPLTFEFSTLNDALLLNHNKLKRVNVSNFLKLENVRLLNLSFNPLEFIQNSSFSTMKSLNTIDLSYCNLNFLESNIFEKNTNLKSLNLSFNNFLIIPEKRREFFNGLSKMKYLETLSLENNSIQELPENFCAQMYRLENLSLKNNEIVHVGKGLFSYSVPMKYFQITINGELNATTFLKLRHLTELKFINSNISKIHKGAFRGLVNLTKLSFPNSNVNEIEPGAFTGLISLRDFDIRSFFTKNNITINRYQFDGLERLLNLNLSGIGIRELENQAFFGLKSLEGLKLSHNMMRKLPNAFKGLKNLKILDLSHNVIEVFDETENEIFEDLTGLSELYLNNNEISKFKIGIFSRLKNLNILDLSNNKLIDLDRHLLLPLTKLRVLKLNSNKFINHDFESNLRDLENLKFVGIGSNNWRCENLTSILKIFKSNHVDYMKYSVLTYNLDNIDGVYCVDVCKYFLCRNTF